MAVWWKRLVILGLVLSIFAVIFVVTPKQEKIVLTFGMFAGNQWDVPDDNCYKIIDETIKEFEKEHPNVTIKYDSGIMKDDYSEEISEKALDLRGLLDALRLVRQGVGAGLALDMGIANKAFDSYEQGLIRDVIASRIPAKLDRAHLFDE